MPLKRKVQKARRKALVPANTPQLKLKRQVKPKKKVKKLGVGRPSRGVGPEKSRTTKKVLKPDLPLGAKIKRLRTREKALRAKGKKATGARLASKKAVKKKK